MMLNSEPEVVEIADMSEEDATKLLQEFCDNGFHGSLEETGLVLGRPEEELQRMLDGVEPVDDDLIMKIRGIAQQRGIDIGMQLPQEGDPAEV